jgi:hypothetical protein
MATKLSYEEAIEQFARIESQGLNAVITLWNNIRRNHPKHKDEVLISAHKCLAKKVKERAKRRANKKSRRAKRRAKRRGAKLATIEEKPEVEAEVAREEEPTEESKEQFELTMTSPDGVVESICDDLKETTPEVELIRSVTPEPASEEPKEPTPEPVNEEPEAESDDEVADTEEQSESESDSEEEPKEPTPEPASEEPSEPIPEPAKEPTPEPASEEPKEPTPEPANEQSEAESDGEEPKEQPSSLPIDALSSSDDDDDELTMTASHAQYISEAAEDAVYAAGEVIDAEKGRDQSIMDSLAILQYAKGMTHREMGRFLRAIKKRSEELAKGPPEEVTCSGCHNPQCVACADDERELRWRMENEHRDPVLKDSMILAPRGHLTAKARGNYRVVKRSELKDSPATKMADLEMRRREGTVTDWDLINAYTVGKETPGPKSRKNGEMLSYKCFKNHCSGHGRNYNRAHIDPKTRELIIFCTAPSHKDWELRIPRYLPEKDTSEQ